MLENRPENRRAQRRSGFDENAAFRAAQPANELISGMYRVDDSHACATAHRLLRPLQQID
jgi:hypothetical protein